MIELAELWIALVACVVVLWVIGVWVANTYDKHKTEVEDEHAEGLTAPWNRKKK